VPKHGDPAICVSYMGRFFRLSSEEAASAFMRKPWIYAHQPTPVQLPPRGVHRLSARELGPLGLGSIVAYLEQGLGRIVRAGLENLAATVVPGATETKPGIDPRLVHPALGSRKQTALALMALELRARNPYARAHHRARHRRRRDAFIRES